ncbi:MAG: magnesium chelatase, partial [Pseudomonadota bacterium]
MSKEAPDPIDDALLAARLLTLSPGTFGGMILRGSSPAREALVYAIDAAIPTRKLPGHVDDERLLGGIDIAASLAAGRPIKQTGLLAEATGGVLLVPMAERLDDAIAGRLAQALDESALGLVLLDDSAEPDDAPPSALMERCAFLCDLTYSRAWQGIALPAPGPTSLSNVAPLDDDALNALAGTAAALGVSGLRPLLFAGEAARAHAALNDRREANERDLAAAVRVVLAPRATQLPQFDEDQPEQPPEPPPDGGEDQSDKDSSQTDNPLDDLLVEAAAAAIPADLLAELAKGSAPRRAGGSGSGQKKKAGLRGKPLGARPGIPRGGARLALIDTLRAAVPWQQVRRREQP